MRVFTCGNCGRPVHFENDACTRCGFALGFLPEPLTLTALRADADRQETFQALAACDAPVQRCVNAQTAGCNWLVPAGRPTLCAACALGRRIPDLSVAANLAPWRAAEAAKRRLVYALLRLRLPLRRRGGIALAFDILADAGEPEPVLTGHANGVVTINLAEADPTERERRRNALGEPYRTLLGHFRHEVGHFYWDALVLDEGRAEACRAVFGDERADYAGALDRHYRAGPPADWRCSYVSAYATMHPWEDFAETWANYLHIVDALDTAEAFGIGVDPGGRREPAPIGRIAGDSYRAEAIEGLIDPWLPLSYALNCLNRSLGQQDLYPFVLSAPAIDKLRLVHHLVRSHSVR